MRVAAIFGRRAAFRPFELIRSLQQIQGLRGLCTVIMSAASEAEAKYVKATGLISEAQALAQQIAKNAASSDAAAVAKLVNQKQAVFDEAADLLRTASEAGHLEARGRLGRWAMFGIGPFPVDGDFAIRNLHDAALGGDADSMYWLARLLQTADELREASEAGGAGGMSVARVLERHAARGGGGRSDTTAESSASHAGAPVFPGDESVADRMERMRAAAAVTQEIRALRRKARKAKIARVLGKRAGGEPEEAQVPGLLDAPSGSEEEMLARLPPLETNAGLAERWLRRAAAAGNGDARVALGNLSLHSDPPRPAQAAGWYLSAVTGASIGGTASEGTAGGEPSTPDSLSAGAGAIDTEAAGRHSDALYNLGLLMYEGAGDEVPRDRTFAGKCFRLAAEAGDPSAQFWVGVAALDGSEAEAGISLDRNYGLALVTAAAESGRHAGAAHYLAQYYRQEATEVGSQAAAGSAGQVWRYLRLAEQGRHGPALFEIGDAYYKGLDGAERDYVLALEYFERAGLEGETGGLLSAGAMRLRGQGCVPDAARAFALYRRAADLGSVQGWINMADMHEKGLGVERSEGKARQIREVVLPSLGVQLPPKQHPVSAPEVGEGGGDQGRQ